MPHLGHDMHATWNGSPKGQAHLSKIIKTVKAELDEFKPNQTKMRDSPNPKPKDRKREDKWQSPRGDKRGGD